MVVSGTGQDKATTNAIVQWTGVGVNLGMKKPGAENIKSAVERVLNHDTYKKKAMEMSKLYDNYDLKKVTDGLVRNVVKGWVKKRASQSPERKEL
jgi:UDP:flavonoid glycosyltransferase YjiC (YdhE family)